MTRNRGSNAPEMRSADPERITRVPIDVKKMAHIGPEEISSETETIDYLNGLDGRDGVRGLAEVDLPGRQSADPKGLHV